MESTFPTPERFCSRLGLCPDNRISGGKILKATAHKIATILYAMIKNKLPFDESLAFKTTPQKEARCLKQLFAQAKHLSFYLVRVQFTVTC